MTNDTPNTVDAAPYLSRLLLAAKDKDPDAGLAAVEDAADAGISQGTLLVIMTQELEHMWSQVRPGWDAQVRKALLEVAK